MDLKFALDVKYEDINLKQWSIRYSYKPNQNAFNLTIMKLFLVLKC